MGPIIALAIGTLAGFFSRLLPLNGKAALAVTAAPLAGVGCSLLWC